MDSDRQTTAIDMQSSVPELKAFMLKFTNEGRIGLMTVGV